MKVLEQAAIDEWCAARGFALGPNARFVCGGKSGTVQLQRYGRPGTRPEGVTQIAGDILAALGRWDECLVWITLTESPGKPLSAASRDPSLSDTTELRALEAHPGRLFVANERQHLSELLYWVLETGRDVHVLPVRQNQHMGVSLFISHDGWLELRAS
jgi:hypothetical protein